MGSARAGRNNLHLVLKNLIFRMPANSPMSCLNFENQQDVDFEGNVLLDCGQWNPASNTQPTHSDSYGLKLPTNNNPAQTTIRKLTVCGFYTGVKGGELLTMGDIVCSSCIVALEVRPSAHQNLMGFLGVYQCTYGIKAAGTPSSGAPGIYWNIANYDIEQTDAYQSWQIMIYAIDDSNDYIVGQIGSWHISTDQGYTVRHTFPVNGARNISFTELGGPVLISAEVGAVSSTTLVATFSQTVVATDYVSGFIVKVAGTPRTINSATRQATKTIVRYILASAVTTGQAVTIEYNKDDGFLADNGGGKMQDIVATTVTNTT